MKKSNKVINYNNKEYLIFLKKHLYILNNLDNNDIDKINYLINKQNNMTHEKTQVHKIFNIIKSKKKKNKSYNLLKKFKIFWNKMNKNFILNKYIDNNTIYLWLSYVLSELLYIDIKKKNILNTKLKENNLYIKLAKAIKINLTNILNNYTNQTNMNKANKKLQIRILKKFENNKIFFITSNRIIKTCLKAKIFYKKTIKWPNKKINYIYLNKKIYKNIFHVIISESIQLPTLKRVQYDKNDKILINDNSNYTLNYNTLYLDALNYLNSQEIIINNDYLKYINNLTVKELYNMSNNKINLNSLRYKNNNKSFKKKILSLIFINTMYIINKYKKKVFYFQYKCDKRGRIYQANWPMNSLYTKILSPLFIFKNNSIINNIEISNFDTFFWYKSYSLNKNNILSVRDATNSIFQISACLLLNEKMLKYSNIHNEDTRYTLYDYILKQYKENIESLLSIILKEYCHLHNKYIDNIKNLDRKFLKSIIMTWSYNESYKSSIKKIYKYIFISNKTNKWIIINNNSNKENIQNYYRISRIIYKYIFDIFKKNFKEYIILRKYFNLIAKIISKKNKNIKINHKKINYHNFEQHIYEKNMKIIYIETFQKKKKCIYIKEINEASWSIKDNKRSLAPNIIQYLDSLVAINVILKCKEKNIPIITNHDCFYTTLQNDKNILEIYNNTLKEMFIEYDFLNDLIIENNLEQENKIQKIYKNILKIRKKNINIIKEIFNKEIKYSISIAYKNYDIKENE